MFLYLPRINTLGPSRFYWGARLLFLDREREDFKRGRREPAKRSTVCTGGSVRFRGLVLALPGL